MFEFYFKRKVLLKIVSIIMTVSLFLTMGFSNCLAISDYDRAMLYSEYVIDQLDKVDLGESLKIDTSEISIYPKKVYKYDDKKIINKNETKELIEDEIIEQDVYKEIEKTVKDLTSENNKNDLDKAAAIYEWVSQNVEFDYDTERLSAKATQSPFCAFRYKKAVCSGFSKLLRMMMRLAGIPCRFVLGISVKDKDTGKVEHHSYNAVYLKNEERNGWTLLDSSWASCCLHDKNKKDSDSEILEKFFPALDKNKSLKKSNSSIISMRGHQIRCVKDDCFIDQSESFGTGAILMSSYIGNLRLWYIPPTPAESDLYSDSDDEDSDEKITDESTLSSDNEKILVNQKTSKQKYNITIFNEISQFKTPIFFKGPELAFQIAKKVFVEGNVEIDFKACDKEILREINNKLDFTRSNKYKFDENNKNIVVDKTSGKEVFNFSKI